jgi:WD40 repeat protein
VHTVAIAPDGTWFVSGGWDRTVRIWDPVTGTKRATLTADTAVYAAAIAPDGTWLATGGSNGTVRVWDVRDELPAPRSVTVMRVEGVVNSVAWHGHSLYAAGDRGLVGFRLVGAKRTTS